MRVLLVEDDPDFGQVVVDHLGRMGHHAEHASNAPQALGLVDSFEPDIVVVDIRLPIFDGNSVAAAIGAHWTPRPGLIAFTSVVDEVDTSLFDAWLQKPATVAQVSTTLTDSLLRRAAAAGS